MKCLQCGLEAKPSEVYQGTQIYECAEGHRTAIYIEPQSDSDEKKKLQAA